MEITDRRGLRGSYTLPVRLTGTSTTMTDADYREMASRLCGPDNAVAKAWTRGRCTGYQILLLR
jgi:hypothetical protein